MGIGWKIRCRRSDRASSRRTNRRWVMENLHSIGVLKKSASRGGRPAPGRRGNPPYQALVYQKFKKNPPPASIILVPVFRRGAPDEVRTRVLALRGPRPRPLDNGGLIGLHFNIPAPAGQPQLNESIRKYALGKPFVEAPSHVIRQFLPLSAAGKPVSPERKAALIWMEKNPGLFDAICETAEGDFPCEPAENPR